jgi:hypothetical protein
MFTKFVKCFRFVSGIRMFTQILVNITIHIPDTSLKDFTNFVNITILIPDTSLKHFTNFVNIFIPDANL